MTRTPCALPAGVLLVEDLGQQHLPARRLAAVLERAGLRARLADLAEGIAPLVEQALREPPRLIVSSLLFAGGIDAHLALVGALKAAGVAAHHTMVGPLATFAWEELLAACPALDSVLRGEAEAGVAALAACPAEPAQWHQVPGLAYRGPAPVANPLPTPAALDGAPFAVRERTLAACGDYGFATLEASRGCFHACTFCLPCALHRAAGGPAYRLRSIGSVVDEIEALYRRGARLFLFDDEQFLPPGRARVERVAALDRELRRRSLRIAFTIKCRPDDVEEGLFRRLQAMGLLRVYVGVESGCPATLGLLGKGFAPECSLSALATLDRLGIVADFRSLLFHPWSTLETVDEEISFLAKMLPVVPSIFSYHEVEVFPGTPLAARLRAEGRGAGNPWPLRYTIADARAELLRRLSRLVFGAEGPYGGLQARVTQAWFDVLLGHRFTPAGTDARRAARLRAMVQKVNGEALAVWREMLAFAGEGDIYDAALVNQRAATWAARVHVASLESEE